MRYDYYDWNSTLAYDAETTLVVGARGIGKTFGLRCQCVRDWIKTGSSFVEIVRHKNRIEGEKRIQRDYFARVSRQFPGYLFKVEGTRALIAKAPPEDADADWRTFGYFVALTEYQDIKNATYPDAYQAEGVRRFIFDEFIIERDLARGYRTYIPGEVDIVASIIDSISRERPGEKALVPPHLYLLANAGDLVNPWFSRYGIKKLPERGYTWLDGKRALLHYVESDAYGGAKADETVAGRLAGASSYADMANRSKFFTLDESLFYDVLPSTARFSFGFVDRGEPFGVWLDDKAGYYFVSSKIPKGDLKEPVFALTKDDSSPNYIQATRAQKTLRGFAELYYYDCIRYESQGKRERFIEALSTYGIR